MASGSNKWSVLLGTLLGAVITAGSGIGTAFITSNQAEKAADQAAKAADKANQIQAQSICTQSFTTQEQNLRSHAGVFLRSIGTFSNLLAHPQLYDRTEFSKNLDAIVVNGLETSAFTSPTLSDLTIRLSESAKKLLEQPRDASDQELMIKINYYGQLLEAWKKQYQLDLEDIKKSSAQCKVQLKE